MLHKVMIAGGGTGGHIFPAIAIGKALKQINPEIELLFVGAEGRMEMEKVPAAGFQIVGLPIQGLPRRKTPLALFRFLFHWYKSNQKAKKILRAFAPDVVVGVGGYASVPAMQAAQKYKIPTFIQEQNSYAGKANRMLARKVQRIAVAYPNMECYFPAEKTKYLTVVYSGNDIDIGKIQQYITESGLLFRDINMSASIEKNRTAIRFSVKASCRFDLGTLSAKLKETGSLIKISISDQEN